MRSLNYFFTSQVRLTLKNIHWIVSYDDTPQIEKLYKWAPAKKFSLTHSADKSKRGQEILFYSQKIKTPETIIC